MKKTFKQHYGFVYGKRIFIDENTEDKKYANEELLLDMTIRIKENKNVYGSFV